VVGKIIITGSGRAGTSFLVQLLTRLGEDTGFTPGDEPYSEKLRAGCEQYSITNLLNGDANREIITAAPRVLKSPDWALVLKDLLRYGWIEVDHVLIPFRDCEEAARSRLDVGLEWQCIITDDYELKAGRPGQHPCPGAGPDAGSLLAVRHTAYGDGVSAPGTEWSLLLRAVVKSFRA